MTLGMLDDDSNAVVTRIHGGRGLRDHLLRLGIIPGVPIRKVQGGRHGPIVLEVLGTNVIVGRSMADAVEVN